MICLRGLLSSSQQLPLPLDSCLYARRKTGLFGRVLFRLSDGALQLQHLPFDFL